jgi:hypothetical protein
MGIRGQRLAALRDHAGAGVEGENAAVRTGPVRKEGRQGPGAATGFEDALAAQVAQHLVQSIEAGFVLRAEGQRAVPAGEIVEKLFAVQGVSR